MDKGIQLKEQHLIDAYIFEVCFAIFLFDSTVKRKEKHERKKGR